ncbi:DUF1129 family protein [Paenalkalicoccus suaedae]|uniref:DUF1129 family protein n=1 Tax=Paenalkalicoccus suaedae TaxID=2592382 RepID=A0A859FB22_9BACI|nr:DUF1129 family protein [Paenalkalicoccus suaedae]QKS69982.1 DUF1129 family protein [Paenalkalicoccus suaedae]
MGELAKEIDEGQKELTKENKAYFSDMVIYFRLSFTKSEEEINEVLRDLLDHLLDAQAEGRSARDVFGDNPKQYANEVMGEIPKSLTRYQVMLTGNVVAGFLGVIMLFHATFYSIAGALVEGVSTMRTYYTGTLLTQTIVGLTVLAVALVGIMGYLRWGCFKNVSKKKEFLVGGLVAVIPMVIFGLLFYFLPPFGREFSIEAYYLFPIGAALLGLQLFFVKKG